MSDAKPGFFKRIFSFGKGAAKDEKPVETEPVVSVPETAQPSSDKATTEPAPAPKPAPEEEAKPAPKPAPKKAASAGNRKRVEKPAPKPAQPKKFSKPAVVDDQPESESPPTPPVQAASPARPSRGKVGLDGGRPEKPAEAVPSTEEKTGWFARLRKGLSRSSQALGENIASVFTKRKLDDDTLQELEDVLIQADLGMETAIRITDALSDQRYGKDVSDEEVRTIMAGEIEKVLSPVARSLELDLDHQPHVILVVGVNGSGKTTTIGKLSAKLKAGGFSTLLVAGDTFRAAAIEQLKIWGERTTSPVIAREIGADAAGLAFDAWTKARDEGHDVMLMDTAGRLQNKTELMAELEKIIRVLKKQDPTAPHTVLLTLDATTGQNALNQVEIFGKVSGVNGLVMTKLDGTARGGILVAIAARHKLPVYFLGVGEGVDDLEPFEARDFARSIAGLANTGTTP
ncbi:MAG: signal recognition particle-docking protein FtsY [Nitratireductor sp.]